MRSQALVSGFEFYRICNYSLCPRYPEKRGEEGLKAPVIFFLNFAFFEQFVQRCLEGKLPQIDILLVHNSDKSFTDQHYEAVKRFAKTICSTNSVCSKVNTLPLGFVDDKANVQSRHAFFWDILSEGRGNKPNLLYMNFLFTNAKERVPCWMTFQNEDWVTKERHLPRKDYFRSLQASKYVLSPPGLGFDCHRIYESIFFDAIPVTRATPLEGFYAERFPFLLSVKDWAEVTKKKLEDEWEGRSRQMKEWKEQHPNWFTDVWFWVNRSKSGQTETPCDQKLTRNVSEKAEKENVPKLTQDASEKQENTNNSTTESSDFTCAGLYQKGFSLHA